MIMSEDEGDTDSLDELPRYFRPFTRESLKAIKERMDEEVIKNSDDNHKKKEV